MDVLDLLEETYRALSGNKVRTILTMLGIVIGISSVIAMVAIGQGAQQSVASSIQSVGSNLLTVFPGTQRGIGNQVSAGRGSARTLTLEDANAITGIASVQAVAPELSGRFQIAAKGTNTNATVDGTTQDYPSVRNVSISEGSWFSADQVKSRAKVAVIGPTVSGDLFGQDDPLGQTIRVNGIQFTIIGETAAKGGSGFGSQDTMVFIPVTTHQQFLSGDQYVSSISIEAASADTMSQAQQDITDLLMQRHNISDPAAADFSIFNQADLTQAASSITQTFTVLLAAIAGISLLVGGIGIMNMMLTTVTERTREIGLRKAIGSKRKDINLQFLVEAIMITFIGGAIGVLLGWGIATAVQSLGIIQTSLSISSIALAFGISAAIGIIFGYYPAQKASRLHPIDALRYE